MCEFNCKKCGIRVVLIVEEKHPENIYCLTCRFIEGLDDDEDKKKIEEFLKTKED